MPSVRSKKLLRARIGDDRAHFAGELAEIAGEEALVFPVEAGGFEEVFAVEIGADSHLHAVDEVHEDKACATGAARSEHGLHISAAPDDGRQKLGASAPLDFRT